MWPFADFAVAVGAAAGLALGPVAGVIAGLTTGGAAYALLQVIQDE